MNPYVVAGYFVYWEFPTETEREAYVALPAERNRCARQMDDNSIWLLIETSPATWNPVGSAGVEDPDLADNEFSGDPEAAYILAKA